MRWGRILASATLEDSVLEAIDRVRRRQDQLAGEDLRAQRMPAASGHRRELGEKRFGRGRGRRHGRGHGECFHERVPTSTYLCSSRADASGGAAARRTRDGGRYRVVVARGLTSRVSRKRACGTGTRSRSPGRPGERPLAQGRQDVAGLSTVACRSRPRLSTSVTVMTRAHPSILTTPNYRARVAGEPNVRGRGTMRSVMARVDRAPGRARRGRSACRRRSR